MTRSEFIDSVEYFSELQEFCSDEGINVLDDYFDESDLDYNVESDICDCDYGWRCIRDLLNDIETGCDFYRRLGWLCYEGCGSYEFEQLKNEVLEIMDGRGEWDPEDDDEGDDTDDCENSTIDEEYVYRDPVIEPPVETFSLEELLGISVSV